MTVSCLLGKVPTWDLPGHGDSYGECGTWKSKGCLEVHSHRQDGLLEAMVGKVFVRRYQYSCKRAECPVCYESWAGKESEKIVYRLKGCMGIGRVIHVVVSPPKRLWEMPYPKLRAKVYAVSKKSGIIGGSCIFHPFRENEFTKKWHFSPHFHILGFGWVRGTKAGYIKHGFVVKNVGIRKTVFGTALYQLSHAGIHDKYHTITWFGKVSYNNLHVLPMVKEPQVCPICGSKLRPLWYFGKEDLIEVEGDFWFDPEGWEYKPQRFRGGEDYG